METLTGIVKLQRSIALDWLELHNQFEFRSAAGAAVQLKFSTDHREPLLHVVQAVAAGTGGADRKSTAIILNGNDAMSRVQRDAKPDDGCGGVFGNIIEGFLHREEEVVALLRGQRIRRQVGWQLQAAVDARRAEEVLRVFAEVIDQT